MTHSSWKLWLDDQLDDPACPFRHPPDGWIGLKSSYEAIKYCTEHGLPEEMSLDFDLGGNDTALTFLNHLCHEFGDTRPPVYKLHTLNPVGKEMMRRILTRWEDKALRIKREIDEYEEYWRNKEG